VLAVAQIETAGDAATPRTRPVESTLATSASEVVHVTEYVLPLGFVVTVGTIRSDWPW
jgi:hypothetical protein